MRSNALDVHLVTLHENVLSSLQVLVAKCIVEVAPAQPSLLRWFTDQDKKCL